MTHVTFKTNFKVKNRSNYYDISRSCHKVMWGWIGANSVWLRFGFTLCQMMSYYISHIRNLLQTCVSDLDLEIGMVYLIREVVLLPSSRFCHQANFSEISCHWVVSRSFWGHLRWRRYWVIVRGTTSSCLGRDFVISIIHSPEKFRKI